MTIAKGKITTKKSGNGGYKSVWIYIPSKVYRDKSFPFDDDEEVLIEIEDSSLIISKNDERSKILKNFGIENATLPKLLEIKASVNKDLPFLYFKEKCYSFQDINRYANQIAHGIINLTAELEFKRPKITLLMNNSPEFIFSWFGIVKADCVFVPIDNSLKGDILTHVLHNSDTEILILDFKFLKNFEEISHNLPKIKRVFIRDSPKNFNFNTKYQSFHSLITQNSENPKINIYDEDPIEIVFTEGCTGMPKSVVYRNVVLAGINLGYELKEIGFNQGTTVFCPMPLFHAATRFYTVLPSLFYDYQIIITENFDPISFWEEIREHEQKPSCFCYFGGYLKKLLFQKHKIDDRNHPIKFAYGFGAQIDTWNAFEKRFGVPLFECWSHMEGMCVTMNKLGSNGGKIGSIGKPLDLLELKIVDLQGNELPPGPDNVGEITVRRKTQTLFEYYKPPENTDVRIGDNGWVFTGDYGYIDHDDFVYFMGKKHEIITKAGEKIITKEIERIANSHPDIYETAVVPITNNSNSKIDLIIYAVKDRNASITPKKLGEYLYRHTAYYHVPRYIEFRENLPKGPSTELLKLELKKEWEQRIERNIIWDTQIRGFMT